jgi:hypothetical protein
MTIIEFLRARIAEDEAAAMAAADGPWEHDEHLGDHAVTSVIGAVATASNVYPEGAVGLEEADAAHIARHDPARVLREVAAKRAIIEEWEVDYIDNPCTQLPDARAARLALHVIATVYSDHPDYDPAWTWGQE